MVKLRLKEFLTANNLSTYRLEREVSGVSRTSLYKLASGDTDGIRFPTLDAIIAALTKLTGNPVTPNDLLEVVQEPNPEQAWLNSSAADLKAALDDLESGENPTDVTEWLGAFEAVAR